MNVMIRFKPIFTVFFLLILSACALQGGLPAEKTELYLTPKDAHDLLKQKGKHIFFVDVRTQSELSSYGMPTPIDANVPYIIQKWNKEKEKTEQLLNNDFVPAIEKKMTKKHLNKQSPIFLICQDGKRSSKSAEVLAKAGYQNVYSIIEGTQGWQKNDLPWSDYDFDEIDFDKL
jgi:rhodanese-related sulfurtransferase